MQILQVLNKHDMAVLYILKDTLSYWLMKKQYKVKGNTTNKSRSKLYSKFFANITSIQISMIGQNSWSKVSKLTKKYKTWKKYKKYC